jgi:AcrR family transcriptional regulator
MPNAPLSSAVPAEFSHPARTNVIPRDPQENEPGPTTGPGEIQERGSNGASPAPAANGRAAGSGNRVEQKKQEKVAAIFKAAEDLLLEHGYHATTIDRIAKQAGVSVGSVYVYFKSKEQLCLALLEKALETQERYLLEAIDPAEDPITMLRRLGRAYLRFFLDHPRLFRLLMFLEHGGLDRGDPAGDPAMQAYDRRTERLLQVLSSQIIEGIHRGTLREVDPARAARFLWGSWTGVIGLTNRTGPTRVRMEDLPRTLELGADIVLGGFLRRDGGLG